ncbi:hypothetical protein [Brevundimonas sp. Root1423]|uniref:hypothetical protein n=1 Tax=Brevundimonas sp. Root1423 TaxID=1736462 RepID=UPI001F42016C|nr:hypothetical protein [Brevundimonas sp. Root1423]
MVRISGAASISTTFSASSHARRVTARVPSKSNSPPSDSRLRIAPASSTDETATLTSSGPAISPKSKAASSWRPWTWSRSAGVRPGWRKPL